MVVVDAGVGLADHDRAAAGAHLPGCRALSSSPGVPGAGAPSISSDSWNGTPGRCCRRPTATRTRGRSERRSRHQVVRLGVGDRRIAAQPADHGLCLRRWNMQLQGRQEFLTRGAAKASRPDRRSEAPGSLATCGSLDHVSLDGGDALTEADEHDPGAVRRRGGRRARVGTQRDRDACDQHGGGCQRKRCQEPNRLPHMQLPPCLMMWRFMPDSPVRGHYR